MRCPEPTPADPKLIARRVLGRHPAWHTATGATGRCAILSAELVDELIRSGIAARRICFKDHRVAVPVPHPEHDSQEEHWAVLLESDGRIIDINRIQFGEPDCELVTQYPSVEAAGRHWKSVYPDELRRKALRQLPIVE